jgi:hypothetical protein
MEEYFSEELQDLGERLRDAPSLFPPDRDPTPEEIDQIAEIIEESVDAMRPPWLRQSEEE